MDEKLLVRESAGLIKKDLRLDPSFDLSGEEVSASALLEQLTSIVREMLDKDFARLMNALYRIDVPEEEVKRILELSAPEALALNLARAILQREQQKVKTRFQFGY